MAYKLLLADDSVTIQRVIELTFADEDVEVTTVGDGQLAIERLDSDPPDIVLADVDMPKRDGYEVAAYVKSRPTLAHIPVVLLTGAFEPIDQARAAAAGSTDVLAKPFEPQMVINRVRELLGKKQQDGVQQPEASGSQVSARPQAPPPPQVSGPTPAGREPAGREAAGESGQLVSLDDYFDQLDTAFSNLRPETTATHDELDVDLDWPSQAPAAPNASAGSGFARASAAAPTADKPWPAPPLVPPPASGPRSSTGAPAFASSDSADKPAGEPAVPETPIATAGDPVAPAAPVAPAEPVAPVVPAPDARPTANPFATLSAAKAEAASRPAALAISDDVMEEIVARVLQRLSDKVVRETVTDIVSQTAERLVQEEIDKIKHEQ
jgi:CheY-like chemotaxis protein